MIPRTVTAAGLLRAIKEKRPSQSCLDRLRTKDARLPCHALHCGVESADHLSLLWDSGRNSLNVECSIVLRARKSYSPAGTCYKRWPGLSISEERLLDSQRSLALACYLIALLETGDRRFPEVRAPAGGSYQTYRNLPAPWIWRANRSVRHRREKEHGKPL